MPRRDAKNAVPCEGPVAAETPKRDVVVEDVITQRKLRLYRLSEIPAYMQHFNEYILSGYRKDLSYYECFRSMFQLHNETGNIWTHLLPAVVFVGLALHMVLVPLADEPLLTKLMFSMFFVGAVVSFASSVLFHTFYCHSEQTSIRCGQLDYQGISLMIIGCFFPIVYIMYYCHPRWQWVYLGGVTLLGLISIVGPLFQHWHRPALRTMRVLLFVFTGAFGLIPLFHHRFVLHREDHALPHIDALPIDWVHSGLWVMLVSYGIGAVFYAFKWPERWYPGKFDYWFQSHQIWHLFGVAGAVSHYVACRMFLDRFLLYGGHAHCEAVWQTLRSL